MLQKSFTSLDLNIFDTFTSLVRHLNKGDTLFGSELVKKILIFLSEVFELSQITLTEDNAEGLILEEGLDRVE